MIQISTAYISHGGGPLPLLGDSRHQEMITTLQTLTSTIKKPDLILVISAHWEEENFTIMDNPSPELFYDYYGFPSEAYSLRYPAKGNMPFAQTLSNTLNSGGIKSQLDSSRGFDHGMFVPLSIMYPDASIPCIQLSLKHKLNPQEHIALGKSLRKILSNSDIEHIFVLGSGSSFHNMNAFFQNTVAFNKKANDFDEWLRHTVGSQTHGGDIIETALEHWTEAPEARFAHPREEHLIPLHVCFGINQRAADVTYSLTLIDKPASMFLWQDQ